MTESQSPSPTPAEWVSVTEAAAVSHVSERTVFRWIDKGRIVSRVSQAGAREVRYDSIPVSDRASVIPGAVSDSVTVSVTHPVGQGVSNGVGHSASLSSNDSDPQPLDLAALEELFQLRARVAELEDTAAEAERLTGEILQSRATIADQRAEVAALQEIRQERDRLISALEESRTGERELRVLMLRQSEQMSALGEQLDQARKALAPPAEDEQPAKRPWWRFGR